jgi:tRNA modification GTPase
LAEVCGAGARLAEPGEFTLRAFLAGRLDLTQAEAVLGVIDAHGDRQLQLALAQLAGGLSGPLSQLRESLLQTLAHLEAGLDFVEEDIEFISQTQLDEQLAAALSSVADALAQLDERADLSDALRIVLVGAPNVGKSSLFNALLVELGANSATAIVENQPGTTRDFLVAPVQLGCVNCELVDTAGVADHLQGAIDVAAQQMAIAQRGRADILLVCLDSTRPLNSAEWTLLRDAGARAGKTLVVKTKVDLPQAIDLALDVELPPTVFPVSSTTPSGVAELRQALLQAAQTATDSAVTGAAATAARCRDSLLGALEALGRARQLVRDRSGEELVAAEVAVALGELGKVVGVVYTDDLLDRIFSRFCIGK